MTSNRLKSTSLLGVFAAIAWLLILVGDNPLVDLPTLCTGRILGTIPSSTQLEYALSWVSPTHLAISWWVMLVAMMTPVLIGPLGHLRIRSFHNDRIKNTLAFLLGYLGIWVLAGIPLITFALILKLFFVDPELPLFISIVLALIWQVMPWKQMALNKCHIRPSLSSLHGGTAGPCTRFGVFQGIWCVISCGPVMLLAMAAPMQSPLLMFLLALWIWAERLELPRVPAVGLYLPKRAVRAIRFRINNVVSNRRNGTMHHQV